MNGSVQISLLGLIMLLVAATSSPGEERNPPPESGQVTEWKGQYGGFKEPTVMVLRDRDASRLPGIFSQLTSGTAIDFSREMLIAIFPGEKRTGGYGIHIVKAEETDGVELLELPSSGIWDPQIDEARKLNSVKYSKKKVFLVEYEEIAPGPGSIVTQALATPYYIKLIKKSPLPVIVVRCQKTRQ